MSTEDQTLDLQRDALTNAGCGQVYEEHAPGNKSDRPQLLACLKALRKGDVLTVWRLDRLGRSLTDLVRIVTDLERLGIGLESLSKTIETQSPVGKLIFHVFAALAEFEKNLIRERTIAGLKAARARGRKGGRRRSLTDKDIRAIRALLDSRQFTVLEIAKRFNVSRATIYSRAVRDSGN